MKEKKEIFTWFADFAYMDLENLDYSELTKIYMQFQNVLMYAKFKLPGVWAMTPLEKHSKLYQEFISLHENFSKSFENIMWEISKIQNLEDPGWTDESYLEGFHRLDNQYPYSHIARHEIPSGNVSLNFDIETYIDLPLIFGEDNEKTVAKWSPDWREKGKINVFMNPKDQKFPILIMRFLDVLNGMELSNLVECQECGRWFLHTSKHKKIYCSNKCAARKGTRDRREKKKKEDPKGYNEDLVKAGDRARKSYEKKVRSENPKAKIHSQPYKRKKKSLET